MLVIKCQIICMCVWKNLKIFDIDWSSNGFQLSYSYQLAVEIFWRHLIIQYINMTYLLCWTKIINLHKEFIEERHLKYIYLNYTAIKKSKNFKLEPTEIFEKFREAQFFRCLLKI